jgi:DNA replication protein DnaC
MDDLSLLKPQLTRLKLTGLYDTLESRLQEAVESKWSYTRLLSVLFTDELERRDNKKLSRRLGKSDLDSGKSLEAFDFTFNSTINEISIREYASCRFLARHDNLLLLGPSGVGKSHLAQAIGHEACRIGHEVTFSRTKKLMEWIAKGHCDGTHERRMKQVATVDLLIMDDFGLEPLTVEQQGDLYEIICERYERASILITSNRDFGEWPAIFSNPLISSAAMDRLLHRASKLIIQGKSYRFNDFTKRNGKPESSD